MKPIITFVLFLMAVLFSVVPAIADDTDIYGTTSSDLKPNVLIILDTSGSMSSNRDVPSVAYDPETDYPEPDTNVTNEGVYYKSTRTETYWRRGRQYTRTVTVWLPLEKQVLDANGNVLSTTPATLDDIGCGPANSDLSTFGSFYGKFNLTDFSCDGDKRFLKAGRFINYESAASTAPKDYRYKVAKDAIVSLLGGDYSANFGLMTFDLNETYSSYWGQYLRNADGGDLIFQCSGESDDINDIKSYVNGMSASDFDGGTPLAETLAEAGLYFAGKSSWFSNNLNKCENCPNKGTSTYTSPITEYCQKNYVILVTDGCPSADSSSKLWLTPYINVTDTSNKYIGKYILGTDDADDTMEFVQDSRGSYYADPITGYVSRTGKDTNNDGYIDYEDRLSFASVFGSSGGHFLDDVAEYLYTNDVLGGGTNGYNFQNVTTFVISFTISGADSEEEAALMLLNDTADKGGGDFYNANSLTGLSNALKQIMNTISEKTAVFAAPSIPTNRVRRTMGGDWIYFSYFKPQDTGEWLGNVKKFLLKDTWVQVGTSNSVLVKNNVLDRDGESIYNYNYNEENNELTISGIKEDAKSYWTNTEDGNDVEKGGAGAMLQSQRERNVYYLSSANSPDLWEDVNAFKTGNNISDRYVNVTDSIVATTLKPFTSWKLGAVIHSSPQIVHYAEDKSLLFVGANDGMLHCFDDTTGNELWAFVPPGQMGNLGQLSGADHNYYVDGAIGVYYGGPIANNSQIFQPEVLLFGERRGGNRYYGLDISNLASQNGYKHVSYKYQIKSDILDSADSTNTVCMLGQSWSRPEVCKVSKGTVGNAGSTIVNMAAAQDVFLIAGGYDVNQDNLPPDLNSTDTKGKAIFAVDAMTGELSENVNFNHVNCGVAPYSLSMDHSIVSFKPVSGFTDRDTNKDILTRIYAGDLGGKLFGFADDILVANDGTGLKVTRHVPAGTFPTRKQLFSPPQGVTSKIFFAPAVAKSNTSEYEWVVFGTGDAEHPFHENPGGVPDRLYVIKNDWKTTVTLDMLVNFTPNVDSINDTQAGQSTRDLLKSQVALMKSPDKMGWYMDFNQPDEDGVAVSGEKLTSNISINKGIIYFTTYVPSSTTTSDDVCAGSGAQGTGRFYSIYLDTGVAKDDVDVDGVSEKHERWQKSPPMANIIQTDGGLIGHGISKTYEADIIRDYFYWRQN